MRKAKVTIYYAYDVAGNRTSEQVGNNVTGTSVNNLNQITSQSAGGTTRFQGTTSEPATVTVNGQPTHQSTSTNFLANPTLTSGTNTVAVVAKDGSGNMATNNYQVVVPGGVTANPLYDICGNMTNNGQGQTYTWDDENRLLSITQGSNTYAFVYDGMGRRVNETDNGTLTKQWVWSGNSMAEELDGSGTITRQFYSQGEQQAGTNYYFTRDHLGSVREMTDGSGNIIARLAYDPYGRTTTVSGTNLPDFQYTGDYCHVATGLSLTLYRAYDANMAKWLSRDPLKDAEIDQGPDLYEYCADDPVCGIDILGLATDDAGRTCDCKDIQFVEEHEDTPVGIPHTFLVTPFGTFGHYPTKQGSPFGPGTVHNDHGHPSNPSRTKKYKACPSTLKF